MNDENRLYEARRILDRYNVYKGLKLRDSCETLVFSRVGITGYFICHPPDESDMQSSFCLEPAEFESLLIQNQI